MPPKKNFGVLPGFFKPRTTNKGKTPTIRGPPVQTTDITALKNDVSTTKSIIALHNTQIKSLQTSISNQSTIIGATGASGAPGEPGASGASLEIANTWTEKQTFSSGLSSNDPTNGLSIYASGSSGATGLNALSVYGGVNVAGSLIYKLPSSIPKQTGINEIGYTKISGSADTSLTSNSSTLDYTYSFNTIDCEIVNSVWFITAYIYKNTDLIDANYNTTYTNGYTLTLQPGPVPATTYAFSQSTVSTQTSDEVNNVTRLPLIDMVSYVPSTNTNTNTLFFPTTINSLCPTYYGPGVLNGLFYVNNPQQTGVSFNFIGNISNGDTSSSTSVTLNIGYYMSATRIA